MALQSSGIIKFSDIVNEFGSTPNNNVGNYRVSEKYGSLTLTLDEGIPSTGTIKFSDFYNKRLNVVVNFHSGSAVQRVNAKSQYNSNNVNVVGGFRSRPTNTSGIKVLVHVNKIIGSQKDNSNTELCALRTGGWDSNTILRVDVGGSGEIYGAGGDGGQGRICSGGYDGRPGTSALGIEYNGTIINNFGYIQCGYGGGGGGGGGFNDPDKNTQDHASSGGGGGGGAGFPAGSGGPAGSGAFGSGRNGDAGSNGSFRSGGAGGSGKNGGGSSSGSGGRGGDPVDSATSGGGGSGNKCSSGGTSAGANGAAIRRASGISFTLNNAGTIHGSTSEIGVS